MADHYSQAIFEKVKRIPSIVKLPCLLIALLWLSPAYGQSTVKEEIPTGKVNRKVDDQSKSPKEKRIAAIYVKDGKKLLIGNPCAIEATRAMGFEYELWHRPDPRFNSNWQTFWHNTGIKTRLFFTRGPWWKSTINKKFKQCAIQSGDFRG